MLYCNIEFQFNEKLPKLRSLKDAIMPSSDLLIFQNEGKLIKLDIKTNIQEEMKLKSATNQGQVGVDFIQHLSDEHIVCTLLNNSIRIVEVKSDARVRKSQQIGFICPYCLNIFNSHNHLINKHMSQHIGPVRCDICKVCFYYFLNLPLILFSRVLRLTDWN